MVVRLMGTVLGERLRRERERRHLSQAEFGKAVGLSDGYVSQIETGKKTPSKETLKAIAQWYGIDRTELAALADYIDAPSGEETIALPAGFGGVVRRLVRQYTPDQLTAFERAMAALFLRTEREAGGKSQGQSDDDAPDADADSEHIAG